ncbi:MAG: N-acetylmuramoyl-L-alanine amidase [Muribaculaceae bacterium]|nr:N-acetylmuramoyl-L-alanine amidase [Muribaculaceae bacterium]
MTKCLNKISSILILLFVIICPTTIFARDFVVVIDAGHGGHDSGAIGVKAQEKNINLAVAKLLGNKIENGIDNVKVVYTRTTDKFISLQQRANIANKAGGDLFISIHVNSVDINTVGRENVAGASVFTLGLHKSEDNLAVAKRENAVMKLENDYTTTYSGFDPNSTESYIIFEMNQNKHMLQSIEFAGNVQKELVKTAGRADRGIRQAGFWVLWATSMPSILVELDFICNPTQEAFLSSSEGEEKLATSIYNAFVKYHSTYSKQILHQDKKVVENNQSKKSTPKSSKSVTKKQTKSNSNSEAIKTNASKEENIKENQNTSSSKVDSPIEDGIVYRIQIFTSDKELSKDAKAYKGLYPIWKYRDGNLWKYTYECTTSLDDAEKMLNKVKNKFPNAFIVKFKDGKRIK